MAKQRIKIQEDTAVPVVLTAANRELIRQVVPDPMLLKEFLQAVPGSKHTVHYTLYDIEEIIGFVSAEANHATDRKKQRQLDQLRRVLDAEMEKYDDGNWQSSE